jgi:hypothetical protein
VPLHLGETEIRGLGDRLPAAGAPGGERREVVVLRGGLADTSASPAAVAENVWDVGLGVSGESVPGFHVISRYAADGRIPASFSDRLQLDR